MMKTQSIKASQLYHKDSQKKDKKEIYQNITRDRYWGGFPGEEQYFPGFESLTVSKHYSEAGVQDADSGQGCGSRSPC